MNMDSCVIPLLFIFLVQVRLWNLEVCFQPVRFSHSSLSQCRQIPDFIKMIATASDSKNYNYKA